MYCLLHSLRGIRWNPSSMSRRVQSQSPAFLTNKSSITGNGNSQPRSYVFMYR